MHLTFLGAARQVTGSMFLLTLTDGYKILVDCGMDLKRDFDSEEDPLFTFHPSDIDLVLLTHAHIDHSGNIPNLIRMGYNGQILCTAATYSLTDLLLRDSAGINLKRVRRHAERTKFSRKGSSNRLSKNIFLEHQVDEAVNKFITIPFDERFEVREDIHISFIRAGHLLGAANILVEIKEDGKIIKLGFSGDIGRKNYPLLKDPAVLPSVDYLICESTYGNRLHQEKRDPEEIIEEVVRIACVEKRGRLIIPAFSVGRTQSILYTLHKLYQRGSLPLIKIFTDSPMAAQSSRIYQRYISELNEEAQKMYSDHSELFDFENIIHVENFQESKAISTHTEPCIIISSSGMITGGRIQHHIKRNLKNPYCTILLIGYSAEGTMGHDLREGKKTISFKGKDIPVEATIIMTDIYSGHGDQSDLIKFVTGQNSENLKKLFLVHGEYESMLEFKSALEQKGYNKIEVPYKGQTFELGAS